MVWIVGVITVIGFGYLMFANEKFRRFGFGLLVLIGVGLVLLWVTSEASNRRYEAEREQALRAVKLSELDIRNAAFIRGDYTQSFTAVVTNRGQHPVKSLGVQVQQLDCPSTTADADSCTVIGEATGNAYVVIPPGQARQVSTTLHFNNVPPAPRSWGWTYSISSIEAEIAR